MSDTPLMSKIEPYEGDNENGVIYIDIHTPNMRVSALGIAIIAHPCFHSKNGEWVVVSADKNGNWKSGSIHKSKQEASKERSKLFKLHRKLAKEREVKRKRSQKKEKSND